MLTLAALLTTKPSRPGLTASAPTLRCRCRADGIEVDKQGAFRHYPTVRVSCHGESACRRTNSAATHSRTYHAADQPAHWRTAGRVRAKGCTPNSDRPIRDALRDSGFHYLPAAPVAHTRRPIGFGWARNGTYQTGEPTTDRKTLAYDFFRIL